jgi:hypothetical protein
MYFTSEISIQIDNNEDFEQDLIDLAYCPRTIKFALNLLIGYELSAEKKSLLKRLLLEKSLENEALDDVNTHNLLAQLFYTEQDERIASWQVKIRIVEIKHLVGINENVYCVVEIGDQRFKTKERSIDNLDFNNEDEVCFISFFEKRIYKNFIFLFTLQDLDSASGMQRRAKSVQLQNNHFGIIHRFC